MLRASPMVLRVPTPGVIPGGLDEATGRLESKAYASRALGPPGDPPATHCPITEPGSREREPPSASASRAPSDHGTVLCQPRAHTENHCKTISTSTGPSRGYFLIKTLTDQ